MADFQIPQYLVRLHTSVRVVVCFSPASLARTRTGPGGSLSQDEQSATQGRWGAFPSSSVLLPQLTRIN